MVTVTDCPRRDGDCPGPECDSEPVRVEEQVINDRKALVYWHGEFDKYCIEYPDGTTTTHTRAADEHAPTA